MGQVQQFSLALVTGASSGIGTAMCTLLAKKKIPLLITGRDSGRLNALAEKLKPSIPVITIVADLAEPVDRARLIDKIHECKPDLIINNAGFGLYGEALTYQTQEQMEIVDVNATAVLELTLESARAMIAAGKKGIILNISSSADLLIFPYFAVYSASKAFVTQFSQSFDFEVSRYGIRVLTACPGMVDTGFRSRASGMSNIESDPLSMTPEFAAQELWRQIKRKKRIRRFDWKTRLGAFFGRTLPVNLIAPILSRVIEKKQPTRKLKL